MKDHCESTGIFPRTFFFTVFIDVILSFLRMRYVAAYLLAALGGNTKPSASDIKAILGSVGIEADDERLNKVRS